MMTQASDARRRLTMFDPDCGILGQDDPLVRRGWERRFMTSASRAEEARATYESLGYQVHMRLPTAEEFDEACSTCAVQACRDDVVVYTKRSPEQ